MAQQQLPFAKGSDTSKAAAESMQNDASRLRSKVLGYIKGCGARGATCDEVEEALDMRHQTASARVNELGKLGQIVDTGNRRPTRSGRNAAVWTVP